MHPGGGVLSEVPGRRRNIGYSLGSGRVNAQAGRERTGSATMRAMGDSALGKEQQGDDFMKEGTAMCAPCRPNASAAW